VNIDESCASNISSLPNRDEITPSGVASLKPFATAKKNAAVGHKETFESIVASTLERRLRASEQPFVPQR
jgi:hypothetical protein